MIIIMIALILWTLWSHSFSPELSTSESYLLRERAKTSTSLCWYFPSLRANLPWQYRIFSVLFICVADSSPCSGQWSQWGESWPRSQVQVGFDSGVNLIKAMEKSLPSLFQSFLEPELTAWTHSSSWLSFAANPSSHLAAHSASRILPCGVHLGQRLLLNAGARTILSTLPIPRRLWRCTRLSNSCIAKHYQHYYHHYRWDAAFVVCQSEDVWGLFP